MADPTGRLNIELQRWAGGLKATIRSSRSPTASRVFADKTVEETATGLPALFSICATAQACACASACEAALGLRAPPAVVRLRRLLVDAETVKEHLWRVLLDWPRFLGDPPQERAMAEVMSAWQRLRSLLTEPMDPTLPGADRPEPDISAANAVIDELAELSAKQLLDVSPTEWLTSVPTPEDLRTWAKSTNTPTARLVLNVQEWGWASAANNQVTALPQTPALDLLLRFSGPDADRFVAEPVWRGEPRESSPFTRRQEQEPVATLTRELGNGLLPRLTAQLVELASLQQALRTGLEHLDEPAQPLAEGTGDGIGIAQVQAARGLLVHLAAVDEDRISDYRILAPTEWNFHPRGVVAQGLSALSPADHETLKRQASLFITAVDPCVDYDLSIS